jgi:acetyl esterase
VRWFDSYDENGTGYFLEMDSVEWYVDQYCEPADAGNHYAFPLQARDLSGLPPATVVTAGYDPLRDEGKAYAERLSTAGVETERLHYDAQIHGFLSLYTYIDRGETAIDDVGDRLRDVLGGG